MDFGFHEMIFPLSGTTMQQVSLEIHAVKMGKFPTPVPNTRVRSKGSFIQQLSHPCVQSTVQGVGIQQKNKDGCCLPRASLVYSGEGQK